MGPHLEGIELMAGEFRDVSSTGKSEQQNLGDVKRLPSAIHVFHVPKPALLVGFGLNVAKTEMTGGQGSVIATRSGGGHSLRINAPPRCPLPMTLLNTYRVTGVSPTTRQISNLPSFLMSPSLPLRSPACLQVRRSRYESR